jgi:acyl-coenzyme A thioesterase 13
MRYRFGDGHGCGQSFWPDILTIVDWAGGLAISTHGFESTGASIDIHVSYMATTRVGDVIEIEGTADKVGRNISFTTVTMTKIVDDTLGPIVAKGAHTKYFTPGKKV